MAYTKQDLGAELGRRGYAVPQRRLQDWIDKDLLPKRTNTGLGRGKGRVGHWPGSAVVTQAIAVCRLLKQHRRVDPHYLRLWSLGFSIPFHIIQPKLLPIVETMKGSFKALRPEFQGIKDNKLAGEVIQLRHHYPDTIPLDNEKDLIRTISHGLLGQSLGTIPTISQIRGSVESVSEDSMKLIQAELRRIRTALTALTPAIEPTVPEIGDWWDTIIIFMAPIVVPIDIAFRDLGRSSFLELVANECDMALTDEVQLEWFRSRVVPALLDGAKKHNKQPFIVK